MKRLTATAVLATAALFGCVKEISSDERLERETESKPVKDTVDAAELAKITCKDTGNELAKARNENKPETERVLSYIEIFESLKKRSATFEEAMTRNPDLNFQEGSQDLVAAKEVCIQQTADVRVEFERYVRDLVDVPTVRDVTGGREVVVARLDFGTLRQAIETLAPDDKDQLLNRVGNAEKKVEVKAPEPRKKGSK